MSIYDKVRYLAMRKGMTLPEFAEKMGIARTALYKWRTHSPSIEMVKKVADYFEVPIDYLVDGTNKTNWNIEENSIDLDNIVNSEINLTYCGEELTVAEKRRLDDLLTGMFWEKKERSITKKKDESMNSDKVK